MLRKTLTILSLIGLLISLAAWGAVWAMPYVTLTLLSLIGLLSLFGIFYLPMHRRRERKKLGLCVSCGYDLRGSKERCPECGARFEKPERNADC